jgi:hypothetical protein
MRNEEFNERFVDMAYWKKKREEAKKKLKKDTYCQWCP